MKRFFTLLTNTTMTALAILAILRGNARSESLISSGTLEIKMNHMLTMGGNPSPVPTQTYPAFDFRNSYPYVDLMLQRTNFRTCDSCCYEWEIGSSFPFYVSQTDFDSTDFSQTLELSNPAKFLTIAFTPGISIYPHVGGLSKSGKFLVFKGDDYRYSLVKILDIVMANSDSTLPTTPCPSALQLYWQKQFNNQPYFEVSAPVGIAGIVDVRAKEIKGYLREYSIDGRKARSHPILLRVILPTFPSAESTPSREGRWRREQERKE